MLKKVTISGTHTNRIKEAIVYWFYDKNRIDDSHSKSWKGVIYFRINTYQSSRVVISITLLESLIKYMKFDNSQAIGVTRIIYTSRNGIVKT